MKVALIGRPNVGKSTLFNRLTETKKAIETPIAGTTRDQNRGTVHWGSAWFELIDSPGKTTRKASLKTNQETHDDAAFLEHKIQAQVERTLKEADIILFMIDFKTGPVPEDYEIIKQLRRDKDKVVILTVNKADSADEKIEAHKYERLGLGSPIAISAKNGSGTGALLNTLIQEGQSLIKASGAEKVPPDTINIAIIGKPNVGKSSLFNAILHEERVVVSPVPHTTRDPQDTLISFGNRSMRLIDTAGLAKRARRYKGLIIERMSVMKTLDVLKRARIVLLLIDATQDVTIADLKFINLIHERPLGVIIVATKWDMIKEKTPQMLARFQTAIYRTFKSLQFAPIVFADVKYPAAGKIFGLEDRFITESKKNVLTGHPMDALLKLIVSVDASFHAHIDQTKLKEALADAMKRHPLPQSKGKPRPRILTFTQERTAPPTFVFTTPRHTKIPDHYIGFLRRHLQEYLNLWGTEVVIKNQET